MNVIANSRARFGAFMVDPGTRNNQPGVAQALEQAAWRDPGINSRISALEAKGLDVFALLPDYGDYDERSQRPIRRFYTTFYLMDRQQREPIAITDLYEIPPMTPPPKMRAKKLETHLRQQSQAWYNMAHYQLTAALDYFKVFADTISNVNARPPIHKGPDGYHSER